MKNLNNMYRLIVTALLVLFISGCELDITNPNAATDAEVLNSREGLISFTVGMQGYFKETALQSVIRNPAVSTREMAINTTFANLVELEEGGTALPSENASILQNWSRLLRVVGMTDQIIASVENVQLADDERSEMLALAHIYKAMSLGYLVSNFEESPIETDVEGGAEFNSREDVLNEVLGLLSDARTLITSQPPSNSIRTEGFDIANTIEALSARYHLMAGNYDDAILAADEVDLSVTSVFSFDGSTSRNPVYEDVYTTEDFAARTDFGSDLTEAGDQRLNFFFDGDAGESTPNELDISVLTGFFGSPGDEIPVYRPGEITLIKAEAYARTDRPGLAVDEINAVRTKQEEDDPFGLAADLPAYSGATDEASLIEEIFRQRSAELYLTGMKLEDSRRLDRPPVSNSPDLSDERNRVYYPYPTQERLSNPNTPDNPSI